MIQPINLEHPKKLSVWRHTNGNYYRVLLISSIKSVNQFQYPTTVVYQGQNSNIWNRPLSDWYRSMSTIDPLEEDGLAWPALPNFK